VASSYFVLTSPDNIAVMWNDGITLSFFNGITCGWMQSWQTIKWN